MKWDENIPFDEIIADITCGTAVIESAICVMLQNASSYSMWCYHNDSEEKETTDQFFTLTKV